MSKLNVEFMDEESGFRSKAEDTLEYEIHSIIKKRQSIDERMLNNEAFEQLSEWRHASLEWYSFPEDAVILEIGAGMGALTGLLIEKAKSVVCIEIKKYRCEIIKDRFEKCNNLQVVNMNFAEYETQEKFDIIVLHDIWGYVKKYYKKDCAYIEVLKRLKTMLKAEGKLIIFAENRLGIKYFSGAYEEYSGKFFTGLNSFDGYDYIKTFTQNELVNIGNAAGFTRHKFYYPYPDCIFPTQIYTDESLRQMYYGGICAQVGIARFKFFDEQRLLRSFQREGIVTKFANAFIIELCGEQGNVDEMNYYYLNPNFEKRMHQVIYGGRNGIRSDMYLMDIIDRVDNGMVKEKRPEIEKIYNFFKKCVILIRSKDDFIYSIRDIYVDNEEFYLYPGCKEANNKIKKFKDIYFITEWYEEYIYGRKSLEKLVPLKVIFDKCKIAKERISEFREEYKKMLSDINSLARHYGNQYYSNIIYPIDIYLNGDLITENIEEQNLILKKTSTVLDENRLLTELRSLE